VVLYSDLYCLALIGCVALVEYRPFTRALTNQSMHVTWYNRHVTDESSNQS